MGRRSRTGCITCRIRRVKCDEAKPECAKCAESGRRCDGYLAQENFIPRRSLVKAVQGVATVGPASRALAHSYQPRSSSSSLSLSRSPPHARQDSDLFDFFRQKTGPSTTSFLPSEFWTKGALQLALTEPAIWHGAAALGALHRRWDLESESDHWGEDAQRLTHRAQFHHGKAMSLLSELRSSSNILALAMILMSSANLMGNMHEAQNLVLEALRSAGELQEQTQPDPDVDSLTEMLYRLDFQAMTFSDSVSPYPYVKALQLRQPDATAAVENQVINSYSQAATALYPLIKRAMMLDEFYGTQKDCGDYLRSVGRLVQDVAEWEQSMGRVEAKLTPKARQSTPSLSLRLWHTMLRLLTKATFVGSEDRWDACLAYFERIVLLAEVVAVRLHDTTKPRLTLEPGLILPLFFTAHRCRQPMLRRRAVALMQRLNSQEGMWRSDAAAMVSQAMIYVEEGLWSDQHLQNSTPHFETMSPTGVYGSLWLAQLIAVPWESWSTRPLQTLETPGYFSPAAIEERIGDVLIVAQFHIRKLKLTFAMASPDAGLVYSGKKLFEITY